MDHRVLVSLSVVSLILLSDMSSSTAQISGGRKAAISPNESVLKLKTGASPPARRTVDPSRFERISWKPRAFIYRGFLINEECDHLISLAKDTLEKSMVVDPKTGKAMASKTRTCSDMSIGKKQDDIVAGIEERIAAWTFLPPDNGEDLQIQRYAVGEKYEPHYDYFQDTSKTKGGNRIATVLMYLSDVAKGGETVFPYSEEKDYQEKDDDWSDCAKTGLAVRPEKGSALLFFSMHLNGTTDLLSLHGGCPVIKGEKWSATKWIHVKAFDDNTCIDEHHLCHIWVALGECEKNPLYMVGDGKHPGSCMKSCKAC